MKRMNFNVNNFILLVFIVFVFSSCVNMSSMQTARVTKKGGYTFIVGAGEINSNIELKDEVIYLKPNADMVLPGILILALRSL